MEKAVILSAVRTPMGAFLGGLKDTPATQLGATAIRAAVDRAGVAGNQIDECLMGMVLPAGLGQAPARQSAIGAGLPQSVRCTTINRVCGSGLKAAMWATQMLQTGDARFVVAGGMENMSRTPYLNDRAREGLRLGHSSLLDSLIVDGLWDVYNDQHMGNCGDLCAKERNISREDQDRFARQSYERAQNAWENGLFKNEVVPVEVTTRKGTVTFAQDEDPFRVKLDKMDSLRPAFGKEGTVTAANASTLADGAAALVLTSEGEASKGGLKPIARIIAHESHAQAPEWFTTAPVGAVQKLLKKADLSVDQIDLFEINEAFAVVALACMGELGLDESKVNIHGGAIAMGHPLGASGARVLTTLIHALKTKGGKYGIATLCIGGGEASAILVENID